MVVNSVPENFDWVRGRAECSLYRVFKELLEGARADVEERNSLRQEGDPSKWSLVGVSNKRFSVCREDTRQLHPSGSCIDFEMSDNGIDVANESKIIFTAAITLNNEGRCMLKVGDSELEQWQVRRMALEGLFFTPLNKSPRIRQGTTLPEGSY